MTNGGYFFLSPQVVDLIDRVLTLWEHKPLERLAKDDQLAAFERADFWQPMNMLRAKNYLEGLPEGGHASGKVWA